MLKEGLQEPAWRDQERSSAAEAGGDRRARGRRGTQLGHLGKELGFSEEQSEAGHL